MSRPLSFRIVGEKAKYVGGKAQHFGAKGTSLAEFLKREYGDLPVTLTGEDVPKLEAWRKGREGAVGVLVSVIRRHEKVEVGYFDV